MWVQFDPSTNDVYAGAAMTNGECIYKSCDGGETWETLPANIAGYYPLQAEISPNGKMYMACSDTAGPNVDPKNGAVYELDLETQEFTDITPSLDDGRYGGFGGITLDAQGLNGSSATASGTTRDTISTAQRTAARAGTLFIQRPKRTIRWTFPRRTGSHGAGTRHLSAGGAKIP